MKLKSLICCAFVLICSIWLPLSVGAQDLNVAYQTDFEKSVREDFPEERFEVIDNSKLEELFPGNNFRPGDDLLPGNNLRPGNSQTDVDVSDLPRQYCMRDEYVVYAPNQDPHGYCWNFAATMSASTALMKATGELYDFSELWTGLSYYQLDDNYTRVGDGGYFTSQYAIMQKSGLMLECDLPFLQSYTMSNENAADYYSFYDRYANDALASTLVHDSTSNYSRSNVGAIKRHIYEHGSIYMTFSFRTGFLPTEGAYYLPPNQTSTNSLHAVSVIGWDDDFEMEVYLKSSDTTKTFKGAWLVLNSYTETSGTDGISLVFYEDTNIGTIQGYRYEPDMEKDFYFYDKIESGFAYPTNVVGKYYGDFTPTVGTTKQKNIFYDDVALEYSFVASEGVSVESVEVYLDRCDVTQLFDVRIDNAQKRFYISADDVAYGQYKVLVTYGDGVRTDTYLNNFFVTYGLFGEEVEFDYANNALGFNTGRELELYSFASPNKNYVIYTNQLTGTVTFLPTQQSVYSDKDMSIPAISYEITDGIGCTKTYTVTADTGYFLNYNFHFEYYEDASLQPVFVYYDLAGGVNHPKNYSKELASGNTDLVLYPPTREGYTFAGWYLDYGNGSRRAEESGGLYYIGWDDIHHMGESPQMFASSHYKKYYKNSNTLFVYARWVENTYYTVDVEVTGEGTAHVDRQFSMSEDDSFNCVFTPGKGWALAELKIDGVAVDFKTLLEIVKNGLTLKNINKNMSISATFLEGTLLSIQWGENVKCAYLTKYHNGETVTFYNGDFIPAQYLDTSTSKFVLTVLVADDTSGNTYVLTDDTLFKPIEKGVFGKNAYIYKSRKLQEFTVSGAEPTPIVPVTVTYTMNVYALDHYISADANAKIGEKNSATFQAGDVVYLFVKKPEDTKIYYYTLPSAFSYVGDQWYRMPVHVNASKASLGRISVSRYLVTYSVVWQNWDGSWLCETECEYGAFPLYCNEDDDGNLMYPTRPDDERYTYTFVGWSPFLDTVTEDVVYTAVFSAVPKQYAVRIETTENGAVVSDGGEFITGLEHRTYTFVPDVGYQIKDVTVNGVSVGAVSSYTLSNVCSDQIVRVEFERITCSVTVECGDNGSTDVEDALRVDYGTDVTVHITPDEKYSIALIKINGVVVKLTEVLTLENITADTLIEIAFQKVTFDITTSHQGSGTVSPSMTVSGGESKTVEIIPSAGYQIKDVTVNGISVGAISSYTFTNVCTDQTLCAVFEEITPSVKVDCGNNGSTDVEEILRVDYGADVTVRITPDEKYSIDHIRINGADANPTDVLVLENITADTLVEITFKQVVFDITTSHQGRGTVTPSLTVSCGENQTVAFSPETGCRVKDVKIDGISIGCVDSYTFVCVDRSHTVFVEYEAARFNVCVRVAGKGNANCDQSLKDVSFGESRALTFDADGGWRLASVFVNGQRAELTKGQLLLDEITEDADILVVFEEENTIQTVVLIAVSAVALINSSLLAVMLLKKRKAFRKS